MLKRLVISTALGLTLAMPAMASHCPADAKAIDGALSRSTLSDMQKEEVKALRDEGMALHQSGDHRKSEQTLAKAMRMLLESQLK